MHLHLQTHIPFCHHQDLSGLGQHPHLALPCGPLHRLQQDGVHVLSPFPVPAQLSRPPTYLHPPLLRSRHNPSHLSHTVPPLPWGFLHPQTELDSPRPHHVQPSPQPHLSPQCPQKFHLRPETCPLAQNLPCRLHPHPYLCLPGLVHGHSPDLPPHHPPDCPERRLPQACWRLPHHPHYPYAPPCLNSSHMLLPPSSSPHRRLTPCLTPLFLLPKKPRFLLEIHRHPSLF